ARGGRAGASGGAEQGRRRGRAGLGGRRRGAGPGGAPGRRGDERGQGTPPSTGPSGHDGYPGGRHSARPPAGAPRPERMAEVFRETEPFVKITTTQWMHKTTEWPWTLLLMHPHGELV